MKVGTPTERDGGLAIDLATAGGPRSVRIAALAGPALTAHEGTADAALAAALLPAMHLHEDLDLEAPVSGQLLRTSAEVQDIFWTWDRTLRLRSPRYQRVAVTAPTRAASPSVEDPDRRGTAAFFTGGVDSFHTAVVHRDELDALVFVHGFDVRLDDRALRDQVAARLRAAADALDLPLVEIETDLQALGDRSGVGWPDYHGAALATVAHVLGDRFSRVLIPATHTYAHLEGLGSHPLLDPRWSSDRVAIVHVGADANRVDKLRRIVEEPAARQHLRVCWENRGGAYNCGRCEKCVRTGVAARIAGVEGRFAGIPSPSLTQVARVRATGRGSPWSELRDELERLDANPRLRRAIDVVLVRRQLARWRPTSRWFA